MDAWRTRLADIARRNLPGHIADSYIALLRPALGLGADAEGPLVGRLGGLPALPDEVAWPSLADDEPLAFISSIDLGELPGQVLDIELPDSGTLNFFYFDGQTGEYAATFEEAPYGPGGARVLYVPAGRALRERRPPPQIRAYRQAELRAEPIATDPDFDHPVLAEAFGDGFFHHPVLSVHDEFAELRRDERRRFGCQLGGYAFAEQLSPELHLDRLDPTPDTANPGTLLAQFSGEHIGLETEDACDAQLYWLIRSKPLAAEDFNATAFVWQCT